MRKGTLAFVDFFMHRLIFEFWHCRIKPSSYMELPSTGISRYDVAAFMALINMVKANLSLEQRPEVYRTLLAVLVDYNPALAGNKERVKRNFLRIFIRSTL